MAELEGANELVRLPVLEMDVLKPYEMRIEDYDAAGKRTELCVRMPQDAARAEMMLRVAVLKQTTWRQFSIPQIILADMYATRMGLDIIAGDVYAVEGGRIATTAEAKIRHAMASGRIAGYEVTITEGKEITFKYRGRGGEEIWKGPDLKAEVVVRVAGWQAPVRYETTLGEWFVGTNPNWRNRTKYMLRHNALSKALGEVAPLGVDTDSTPPIEQPPHWITGTNSSASGLFGNPFGNGDPFANGDSFANLTEGDK
jgi:hypothetical protein